MRREQQSSIGRSVGAVVIGRNEGERLEACLRSLEGEVDEIVYVDSGSSDESVARARRHGARIVELDASLPFTASRARNAGAKRLAELRTPPEKVLFIDGDCELFPGFLSRAIEAIESHEEIAVVCGVRKERAPRASIYNLLCDIEWDGPEGFVDACGGDALMKADAFWAVGGFDESLIAGEEPELCLRLRRRGEKILRIPAEMTRHDADLRRFNQWFRRAERAGHAFIECALKHRGGGERYWQREALRPFVYVVVVPFVAFAFSIPSGGLSLLAFLAYPISFARGYRAFRARGRARKEAAIASASCLLGRVPELVGEARFLAQRARGRSRGIIEYKEA